MPRVVLIDPSNPAASTIREAADLLRRGELVAFPTETVYGLGARGLSSDAVARVFAAKGRPALHPLILHVLGVTDAALLVRDPLDARTRDVIAAFWPGPLTLVLPRSAVVPDLVTGGGPTVALRAPSHAVARALIAELGEPIAAPSANRYQTISPTIAAHVVKSLGDAVALVIDAGACTEGIESTVLDLTEPSPRILRPGAITLAALRRVLPDVTSSSTPASASASASASAFASASASASPSTPHRSPGQDVRHYAPRARLELLADRAAIASRARALAPARVGVIVRELGLREPDASAAARDADKRDAERGVHASVIETLSADPSAYGRELYAALHRLDDAAVDVILVERTPADDAWAAVADRLMRAATAGAHEK